MKWLKQATASNVMMGPFVDDTDGKTLETGLTIAQADIRISKGGAAFAQTHNSAGATHDENGYYIVPLDTTDTESKTRLRVSICMAGALPVFQDFMVLYENTYQSLVTGDAFLYANTRTLNASSQSLADLKDFADAGYDPSTHKVAGVVLVDETTTNADMVGTDGANTVVPDAAGTAVTLAASQPNYAPNIVVPDAADTAVVLAASQPNYAPNVVVPDAAGVAPTAAEIKTAVEAAGSSLATLLTDLGAHDGKLDIVDTVADAIKVVTDSLPDAGALTTISGLITTLDTVADAIKVVTDNLADLLEDDAGTQRFTTNALEQAPSGDATEANQTTIED